MIAPGAVCGVAAPVVLFSGRRLIELTVRNTGDRAVQVGSHYHFAQANPALELDRSAALGFRLAIPAGTAVRFEPGVETVVSLVPLGGAQLVPGLRRDLPRPASGHVTTAPPRGG